MERAIDIEERIRRAEEIYNRRKMQNGVRVATARVTTPSRDKYKLYKKLIIQILICFAIYTTFYLIKNSNYIFSQDFISKTKEVLFYDINFQNVYNSVIEYYNNNLKTLFNANVNQDKDNTENKNEESTDKDGNPTEGIGGGEDENVVVENNKKTDDLEESLSQMEIDAREIKNNYSFILPLNGVISSRYGPREGSAIVSSNHAGIDIAEDEGTVFVSAMEGEVVLASSEGSYGNHLYIQNGDVITVYAHCKKLYVTEGDNIFQGQELGEVGQTGNATGPHLHFEVRKENRTVDPELILSFE